MCEYSSLFPLSGIQSLCSGQTLALRIPQPSFEGRSFFCTQHQQTPGPSPPLLSATATHPPNQICSGSALLLVSLLRFFCSTLSAAHTPTVPQAFLFTLAQMCALYIWLLLIYFITFHHYWTLGEHVRVLRSAQKCPDTKTSPFCHCFTIQMCGQQPSGAPNGTKCAWMILRHRAKGQT